MKLQEREEVDLTDALRLKIGKKSDRQSIFYCLIYVTKILSFYSLNTVVKVILATTSTDENQPPHTVPSTNPIPVRLVRDFQGLSVPVPPALALGQLYSHYWKEKISNKKCNW